MPGKERHKLCGCVPFVITLKICLKGQFTPKEIILGEKADISTDKISKSDQLRPKQSKWENSTTGKREQMWFF